MVVRCVAKNDTKAWYDDNKAQIFADFGSLYSAQMSVDGIDARTGEAYDDMVLVKNEAAYTQSGEYVIIFTYETLTDSFVQETEDKVDFDLNGLKRLTRTIIAKDTVAYDSVVGTTTIVDSSPLLTLAQVSEDQLEASEDGFKRIQEVWLGSGTLSETLDNVGSQKAKVIETIGADPDTPTGYSLASKQESDFEGFQTNRFTFLKDNVVLSESEDKVGSQEAIVKEVFNGTPATPSGYSVASKQESDVDGIPTKRFTFLKNNVILSRSEDKVGSQLAITTEVFNPTSDPTESGYSLAREEVSDVEGIPTKRYTFLKDNVELSRSEDKVGSQLAIVTEVFKPDADPTETGYVIARTEVSDVEGIPTKRFTFLKENVVLSVSEDEVGSQNAIVEEWFKPSASRDTKANYSLARKEESDVGGIPTERYTFLKDNVVLSVSEDKVGSQKAIVNEVFNPASEAITGIDTSGTALFGYSEANRTESDYEGIKTIRVQFLKPSILSLQQDFNNGLKRVSVQAFGMTATNVSSELAAITTSHELISQTESDYEGIKTSTFQYQIDEAFTEDYELNGLKRISMIELSTSNLDAISIGSQGATATPQVGLYLATQDIDNGGIIKVRESTWLEAGTLNVQRRSESEGVYRVTTTFLGVEGSVVGPIIARVEDDYEGLKTITVVSMQDASGASLVAVASQPVASHSTLSEFSYPGVVTISAETLSGQNSTYTFNAKDFSLKPPVVSRVPATIKVSFKTTSAISYTGTGGLWNPTTWAEGSSKGIGWNYTPFSIARGFRGYRIDPNATNSYSGFGIPGTSNVFDMISGKRIFGDTTYSIQVSGGPPDPSGVQYTLDYSVSLAFEDVNGVPYYKHKEIVATIPSQAGASGGGSEEESEETTDVLP